MIKKIPLCSEKYPGLVMLCDEEDYEKLSLYKWYPIKRYNNFYAETSVEGEHILAHRFLLGLTNSSIKVDHHPDRSGLNNTRINLRSCSHAENLRNRGKQNNNSSGFKGVVWAKWANKWRAQIHKDHKGIHIGYFNTREEAYAAYCKVSKEMHGEFFHI